MSDITDVIERLRARITDADQHGERAKEPLSIGLRNDIEKALDAIEARGEPIRCAPDTAFLLNDLTRQIEREGEMSSYMVRAGLLRAILLTTIPEPRPDLEARGEQGRWPDGSPKQRNAQGDVLHGCEMCDGEDECSCPGNVGGRKGAGPMFAPAKPRPDRTVEARELLAGLLENALIERNEERFRTIAFVNRHEIIATLQARHVDVGDGEVRVTFTADFVREAVAAERERCAKIADGERFEPTVGVTEASLAYNRACHEIATAVRSQAALQVRHVEVGLTPIRVEHLIAKAVAAETERCARACMKAADTIGALPGSTIHSALSGAAHTIRSQAAVAPTEGGSYA